MKERIAASRRRDVKLEQQHGDIERQLYDLNLAAEVLEEQPELPVFQGGQDGTGDPRLMALELEAKLGGMTPYEKADFLGAMTPEARRETLLSMPCVDRPIDNPPLDVACS